MVMRNELNNGVKDHMTSLEWCSTTGVTKAMVCIILSVRGCRSIPDPLLIRHAVQIVFVHVFTVKLNYIFDF